MSCVLWTRCQRRFRLATLLAFLVCVPLAAVEPPPEPDFTGMSLEELAAIEVPNVYGASRHEQKVTEAPSAVSIVTADEIRRQGYRTLGAILRSVRGLYVDYDRAYDFIGVRGVNRPGDYGGRILITVDGHRLNDPIYDSASGGTDFILDVDLIERVEVIRGPGSSVYGNNAFFGVVNVVTRKGRELEGAELAGSAGSFDTYTGRASYGSRLANGAELLVSGTVHDSAGDPRLFYPEFSSVNGGVAEDMDGGWARNTFASVSWRDVSFATGFVKRRKTWPTAAYSVDENVVAFNDPRLFSLDERAFADLAYNHAFTDDTAVLARAYYDQYDFHGQYPYEYVESPVTLNRDEARSRSVGGEVQASKRISGKHRITAGAEIRHDFQLDQTNFDVDPPAVYVDSQESGGFLSFYVQDEIRLSKDLILNAGARYDRFTSFGDTVNPRAALIYQASPASTFKLLYGRAFRAPNAFEYFYESGIDKRNPGLGPETIHAYELVWEQQVGKSWRTSASVFYNDVRDLIGYTADPADGLFFFDNLDTVVAKGAEIEAEARWAGGAQGRISYTYTRTEDTATGLRLSNSPAHLGKLGLSLPFWTENVFASLELQGMSERHTVRGNRVSGAVLANATLLGRELVKGLDISASIYNLFDRRYSDPVGADFRQDSIEQDGRTFRIGVTGRF